MSADVPGERPPVLSAGTRKGLDELRRFRHFVRHGYGATFDPQPIRQRVAEARAIRNSVDSELDRFERFVSDALVSLG